MRTRHQFITILILAVVFTGCSEKPAGKPEDKVTLQLKWSHQAQFAGFYVAKDKGYYKDAGIDMAFLEGGADVNSTESLLTGKADFAVLAPDQILASHMVSTPITAISVIFQKSPVVYLSLAESGITRPSDFIGKTVACKDVSGSVSDFEFQFSAMMKTLKLPLDSVHLVPFEPDHHGLLSGTVDVTTTYVINGAILLKRKGLKLNMIWPDDYGVHCFSDTLATLPETVARKPDLVYRFLKATLRGWQETLGNSDEAMDIIMTYARSGDRAFQTEMLNALAPLVHTGEAPVGWMSEKDWVDLSRLLSTLMILEKPVNDLKNAYTLQFLEQIYGGKHP